MFTDRIFFLLSGDFSLHIYPVELEDDGTYQCQASPTNDGQPALRSRFAKLSVLVPPQKPKILQGDFLVTTEDRELVIECISSAGKPPAEASTLFSFYISSSSFGTFVNMDVDMDVCMYVHDAHIPGGTGYISIGLLEIKPD